MNSFWFKGLHYLTILFHCVIGALMIYFITSSDGDDKRAVSILAAILGVVSLLSFAPFSRKREVVGPGNRLEPWQPIKIYHFLTIGYHLLISVTILALALTDDHHLEYWSVALGGLLVVTSIMAIYPIAKNDYCIRKTGP